MEPMGTMEMLLWVGLWVGIIVAKLLFQNEMGSTAAGDTTYEDPAVDSIVDPAGESFKAGSIYNYDPNFRYLPGNIHHNEP